MRAARLLVPLVLCLASPLGAQGLVGRWAATTEAIHAQTGQQVHLRAEIQFHADSTFAARLTSDDGSGERGQTAITTGQYRTITDPWGNPMVCVKRDDGRDRPHCQSYRVIEGRLEWGSMVFGPDLTTQPS